MITPTPGEVIAIKEDAQKRFGSSRVLMIQLSTPIDAAIVVSPFGLKSYSAHVDARSTNVITAQGAATIGRLLWASPERSGDPTVDTIEPTGDDLNPARRVAIERVEALREAWPALDARVAGELRTAAGWAPGWPGGELLSADNAPPGLGGLKLDELLSGAPKRGAGSLWSVRGNNLGIVMRAPLPDVYLAARSAFGAAHAANTGIIDSILTYARELVAWTPKPLDDYLEELPARAEGLWQPFLQMGGDGALALSSFL